MGIWVCGVVFFVLFGVYMCCVWELFVVGVGGVVGLVYVCCGFGV